MGRGTEPLGARELSALRPKQDKPDHGRQNRGEDERDEDLDERRARHAGGMCQRDRRYSIRLVKTKAAAARRTTVPPGGMSA